MSYAKYVREKISSFQKEEGDFRNKLTFYSKEYREVLGLIEGEPQALRRLQEQPGREQKGFLTLDVDGERFGLSVNGVLIRPDGEWDDYIMATCLSNSDFNKEFVFGNNKVCIVTNGWHQKIIEHLLKEEDKKED